MTLLGIFQRSRPTHCMSHIADCKISFCTAPQVEDAVDKAAKEELMKAPDEQRSSQAQASTSSRAGPDGDPRDAAGEVLLPAHSAATPPCGQLSFSQQASGYPGILQVTFGACIIVPAAAMCGQVQPAPCRSGRDPPGRAPCLEVRGVPVGCHCCRSLQRLQSGPAQALKSLVAASECSSAVQR